MKKIKQVKDTCSFLNLGCWFYLDPPSKIMKNPVGPDTQG